MLVFYLALGLKIIVYKHDASYLIQSFCLVLAVKLIQVLEILSGKFMLASWLALVVKINNNEYDLNILAEILLSHIS